MLNNLKGIIKQVLQGYCVHVFLLYLQRIIDYLDMTKRLLTILFIVPMLFGTMAARAVEADAEIMLAQPQTEIQIIVEQGAIRVAGAAGETMHVYNVTGVEVMNMRVDSQDKRFHVNLPKGFYIIKVGKVVRKVYLR
jgi:hypothetical protein